MKLKSWRSREREREREEYPYIVIRRQTHPSPILENETHKLLVDFDIQTDHLKYHILVKLTSVKIIRIRSEYFIGFFV